MKLNFFYVRFFKKETHETVGIRKIAALTLEGAIKASWKMANRRNLRVEVLATK